MLISLKSLELTPTNLENLSKIIQRANNTFYDKIIKTNYTNKNGKINVKSNKLIMNFL